MAENQNQNRGNQGTGRTAGNQGTQGTPNRGMEQEKDQRKSGQTSESGNRGGNR